MDHSVTLSLQPVCECGKAISDLTIDVDFTKDTQGYKHPSIAFSPMYCPNCGKYIDGIQVDGRYVDMFKKR